MAQRSTFLTSRKFLSLLLAMVSFGFSFAQTDVTRPAVVSVSPGSWSISINAGTNVSATFSEAMNAATINGSTFELRNALNNAVVTATVTYNAATRTATLYPTTPLFSLLFYAKVKGGTAGVKDMAGNTMVSDYSWYFIMIPLVDLTPPTVLFVSPANGATGVSTSTDVTAVLSEEMMPSSINASSVELRNAANVLVPSTISYNVSTRTIKIDPASVLTSSTLYRATIKGGASGVKDEAGNCLPGNYTWSFTTIVPPSDQTPPTIISVSPINNSTGVSIGASVSATFSESMNAATITGSTFELRNPSNSLITCGISYNAGTRKATLTPSAPLDPATLYTATVKGGASGVKDVSGLSMVNNYTWSFTTAASIFGPGDLPQFPAFTDQPVEVGFRFRSNINGQITGLKFYKGLGNIGTHTGHLWTNAGILLGTAVFTNETESGWQEVLFSSPINISADVTYVASYHSSAGIYAYTNDYFTQPKVNGPLTAMQDGIDGSNGAFKYSASPIFPIDSYRSTNYFVDVLFGASTAPDVTPPVIIATSPISGANGVNVNSTVTATFGEGMIASTITSSSFELRSAAGTLIPANVTYNPATMTATLTTLSPLAYYTEYTAKVKGGSAGVKDLANNPMTNDHSWTFRAGDPPLLTPTEGPGGPILVVSTASNPFSRYAVEILRAEGLNEFAASDISAVTSTTLNSYDVVVLGEMTLTADQVLMLTNWVNAGGTLIAFKPSALLAPLMGLLPATGTLSDKYLLVNTASGPGVGIVNQTIQFHGTANLHVLSGAASVATLFSSATASTVYPAATMRNVGVFGGRAYAFTYDLAKSIVYTRQGNPAWAGQKRDGQIDPIRPDDLFFPDWIDFNKVIIPQADEQQRLLANMILQGNLHRKPLPRFWYLPRDLKAAIVMTGDDHSNNGTDARFNQYKTLGPNSPQDVADWKAVRGTAYLYPSTPMSNAQALAFETQGFEIAMHPSTNCLNYTPESLAIDFGMQYTAFRASFPSISPPVTNRTHCLVWSDWASEPKVQLQKGMRFDVTYYNWPEVWMQNRPGVFTGSGMPMRYADLDGSLIDVYQAPTQMTDETNMNYTSFCNTVLDKAIGSEGYYGVFTANMHNDSATSVGANAIIASALSHNVPVITSKQMLTWLDGRNNSSFGNMTWNNNQLTFTITARTAANNLKAMLPLYSENGQLISITRNGNAVSFTTKMIKGIQYAFFAPVVGVNTYVATYGVTARVADPVITTETEVITTTEGQKTTTEDEKTASKQKPEEEKSLIDKLYVNVLPNPSVSYFNLIINSNDANPVKVRVYDMFGRLIEVHEKITSTGILRLGQTWRGGAYFAEVIQGDQRKVVKLIKTN